MSDAETLAEMRRQYRYATLESHMLADGVLHLRCHRCRERPIPHAYSHVLMCDPCLDEVLAEREAAKKGSRKAPAATPAPGVTVD